ncbi:hypothetical protein PM082_023200 [Marasmius tenuissimus]|nr:hypothetical protein PM082_023200 [Marasmius tenuissimus]
MDFLKAPQTLALSTRILRETLMEAGGAELSDIVEWEGLPMGHEGVTDLNLHLDEIPKCFGDTDVFSTRIEGIEAGVDIRRTDRAIK